MKPDLENYAFPVALSIIGAAGFGYLYYVLIFGDVYINEDFWPMTFVCGIWVLIVSVVSILSFVNTEESK